MRVTVSLAPYIKCSRRDSLDLGDVEDKGKSWRSREHRGTFGRSHIDRFGVSEGVVMFDDPGEFAVGSIYIG